VVYVLEFEHKTGEQPKLHDNVLRKQNIHTPNEHSFEKKATHCSQKWFSGLYEINRKARRTNKIPRP
jgi:hypothetical protein